MTEFVMVCTWAGTAFCAWATWDLRRKTGRFLRTMLVVTAISLANAAWFTTHVLS